AVRSGSQKKSLFVQEAFQLIRDRSHSPKAASGVFFLPEDYQWFCVWRDWSSPPPEPGRPLPPARLTQALRLHPVLLCQCSFCSLQTKTAIGAPYSDKHRQGKKDFLNRSVNKIA